MSDPYIYKSSDSSICSICLDVFTDGDTNNHSSQSPATSRELLKHPHVTDVIESQTLVQASEPDSLPFGQISRTTTHRSNSASHSPTFNTEPLARYSSASSSNSISYEVAYLAGCRHYYHDQCINIWSKTTNSKLSRVSLSHKC